MRWREAPSMAKLYLPEQAWSLGQPIRQVQKHLSSLAVNLPSERAVRVVQ